MKITTKLKLKAIERENLSDSNNGLIIYTNGQVAEVENIVVQKSGVDHNAEKLAALRTGVDHINGQRDQKNTIPEHAYDGFLKEKRKKLVITLLLVLSETFLTYYALKLMIARGDNSLSWTAIRFAVAIVATTISVLAAEEFFKKYFKGEKIKLQHQYNITDGKDEGLDDQTKPQKSISEAAIWFILMILANVVVFSFALTRSQSIESNPDLASTIALVLLSAVLPIIGGLIYAIIDRLSYVIRAYRKQVRRLQSNQKIERALKQQPVKYSNIFKNVVHKECAKAYTRIITFQSLINNKNAKKSLPKASIQGIEFISSYNDFLTHIQNEINGSTQSAIKLSGASMIENFNNMPTSSAIGQDTTDAKEPESKRQPADEYSAAVINDNGISGKQNGSRIAFDKN